MGSASSGPAALSVLAVSVTWYDMPSLQLGWHLFGEDEADCVMIVRLAAGLHCHLPEQLNQKWRTGGTRRADEGRLCRARRAPRVTS